MNWHPCAAYRHINLTLGAADQLRCELSYATSKYWQLVRLEVAYISHYTIDNDAGGAGATSRKLCHGSNAGMGVIAGHVDNQYVSWF
ncbi:hypothetical protein METHP14_10350 [Pseudomonas sp. P14-2025]